MKIKILIREIKLKAQDNKQNMYKIKSCRAAELLKLCKLSMERSASPEPGDSIGLLGVNFAEIIFRKLAKFLSQVGFHRLSTDEPKNYFNNV